MQLKKTYGELFKANLERKRITEEKFSDDLKLIESTLADLFYYSYISQTRMGEEAKKKGTLLKGPKSLIPLLFSKANHFLIATYQTALYGLYNPTNSLLRSIFEIINKVYFLYLGGKDAEIYYKYDGGFSLTKSELKYLKKNRKYFGDGEIRKILFSETQQKSLKEFYKIVSQSTHSSIIGVAVDFDYNEQAIIDKLNLILSFEFSLLIALVETHYKYFRENELREINILLNKIGQKIGDVPDLIPNKEKFSDKLKIKFNKLPALDSYKSISEI